MSRAGGIGKGQAGVKLGGRESERRSKSRGMEISGGENGDGGTDMIKIGQVYREDCEKEGIR